MAEATTAKTPAATILCVDDELNILSSMKRLFRPFGSHGRFRCQRFRNHRSRKRQYQRDYF